jgi:hypothetical protein
MPLESSFIVHATGNWSEGHVEVAWIASTRREHAQVEQEIDRAWAAARLRLGDKLFDGPMCRLERWNASADRLQLTFSRTSYRPFLGVDLMNPHLTEQFGREIMANPMGVSSALETADGWLLMGRRNDSVAYYPDRVHPFAGALEPRDRLDVFSEVRRELGEELALQEADIAQITCLGMIEDRSLRQPELVFHVRSTRTRSQIESTLDRAEHHGVYPIRAVQKEVAAALADPVLTPVAQGTLTLWSRGNLQR